MFQLATSHIKHNRWAAVLEPNELQAFQYRWAAMLEPNELQAFRYVT